MTAMGRAATVSFYVAVGGKETCLDLFVIAPLAGSLKISNNSLIVASGVDHSEGLLLRHHPDAIPVGGWGMSHEVLATPDISGGQLVFGMAAERLLELGDGV